MSPCSVTTPQTRPGAGTDGRYRHVLDDPGAGSPRALGQRLGDIHGVRVAVRGDVYATEYAVGIEQRYALPDRFPAHHIDLQPEYLGHGRAALEFLEALRAGGDGIRPAAPITRCLPRFFFQGVVELPGIAGEIGHVDRRAQLADQAGCMPGGAGSDLPALEQEHIDLPRARKVIGDRAPDHATPDDNYVRAARQLRRPGFQFRHPFRGTVDWRHGLARHRALMFPARPRPGASGSRLSWNKLQPFDFNGINN